MINEENLSFVADEVTDSSRPVTHDDTEIEDHTVREDANEINYAAILDADVAELKAEFPELEDIKDIYDLANPVRFGALRDLGLSTKEAYLASGGKRTIRDNRRHLTASVPRTARSAIEGMSHRELNIARELFGDMSDAEIQRLYRKVKG